MSNIEDFLRYRSEARVLFPVLKQYALVQQTGTDPSWEHFNSAGIPQYNVPLGYDMNDAQRTGLTGYHEPGHEFEEYLRNLDLTKAHRQAFLTFIGEALSWDVLKAIADAMTNPNEAHEVDPGEWWADGFADAVAGVGQVGPWRVQAADPLALRAFFQGLAGISPPTLPPPQNVEWLGPVPTNNYTVGRSGNPISLIVDHWMAASFDSALAHFMSPTSQVSANYLISKFGRIVQVVKDEDTAYHAGDFAVNQRSIGIEHEASPTVLPSDALYAASAWLHHKLSLDYGLHLVVGETVKPHRAIVPTACPGTLDLDRLVREAGGAQEVTDQEFIDFYNRLIKPGMDATIDAMKSVETNTVVAVRAAGEVLTKTNL